MAAVHATDGGRRLLASGSRALHQIGVLHQLEVVTPEPSAPNQQA
jgi:hypothetical protein